jgi:signal transduction histidine kinase
MVRRAIAGTEAAGTYSWPPARQERVGALAPIRSIGWVAHASRPLQAAMAPVRQAALFTAAGLLAVAVATLAAALVLARRITEPLRALEQHAARLAGNGTAVAPVRGPTEVRRVARALDAMAAAVAKRQGDLETVNSRLEEASRAAEEAAAAAEARRAELQALVAALPVGFAIVDARQGAIRANDLAREILGAAPGDLSGPFDESRRRFRLHRPDGTAVADGDQPVDRALRGEIVLGDLLRVEREGSGRCVWIAANAAPIRSADGAVHGAAVAFLDVTHLRELEEERETLMQTVSHDLRTPLHAVVGHARILQRRGDDETRRRSAAILASASRMTRLIGDLVDAARLEAGYASLRLEPLDLSAFLAGWKERMAGALAVERVTVAAPAEVPVVLADPGRLDQILVNLVSNALKYSVAESEVRVELTATESALRLSVTDRGPGIRAEEVPRLFERYYRAASAGREEGLGLGLFITRKLVEAHQWRIEVASEPGSGSVFTVVIPRTGTKVAAAPIEDRSEPARRHAR